MHYLNTGSFVFCLLYFYIWPYLTKKGAKKWSYHTNKCAKKDENSTCQGYSFIYILSYVYIPKS